MTLAHQTVASAWDHIDFDSHGLTFAENLKRFEGRAVDAQILVHRKRLNVRHLHEPAIEGEDVSAQVGQQSASGRHERSIVQVNAG